MVVWYGSSLPYRQYDGYSVTGWDYIADEDGARTYWGLAVCFVAVGWLPVAVVAVVLKEYRPTLLSSLFAIPVGLLIVWLTLADFNSSTVMIDRDGYGRLGPGLAVVIIGGLLGIISPLVVRSLRRLR